MTPEEKPNTSEPPGRGTPSPKSCCSLWPPRCPRGRVRSARALRDTIERVWPPAWRGCTRGPRGEPSSRSRSTHFSPALGAAAGAQLGSAAAICKLTLFVLRRGRPQGALPPLPLPPGEFFKKSRVHGEEAQAGGGPGWAQAALGAAEARCWPGPQRAPGEVLAFPGFHTLQPAS